MEAAEVSVDGLIYKLMCNGSQRIHEQMIRGEHQKLHHRDLPAVHPGVTKLSMTPKKKKCEGAIQPWGVNYDPSQVCVLEGSTVKLGCIFKYPCEKPTIIVEKKFWFTEINNIVDLRDNPDYRDRVEWNPPDYDGYRNCTLTIRRLRRTDSATYKFRFETNKDGGKYTGEPGVDLKVTGLTVVMSPVVTEGQKVILTCDTSCNLPEHTTFTWHQNGKALPQSENQHPNRLVLNTVGRQDAGIYTCYVKNQNFSAPERTLTVQYAPDAPSVSVSPDEIKENSSVTLTCRGDAYPAIQTYTWFKENGNQSLGSETENLVFDHIQSFDSGKYFCTVANKLGSNKSDSILIDVKYAPTNTSLLVSPSDEIKEGDSVTLNCRSDANPPANFTWYKDNQTLPWELRKSYTFTSIRSEDSGTYRCRSENEYGHSYSANLSIAVQYAPRVPSVSGKLEDSWRLTLTCSSDAHPSVDNYTWFKENEDSPRASGRTFTITDFRINQIGNYYCQAQNRRGAKNSTYQLIVVAGEMCLFTYAHTLPVQTRNYP
ncbi:B-cell receptor CD22-like [Lampris incognitus]|uniref:B-cell receptor CD22-like n=1 Tax=Lampris incognitus TaxID=2546036 RepID=UPI0024B574AE|nr:B-cell receptor CD22-like [Lampris incognitus]